MAERIQADEPSTSLERLVFFSDAIFAIAITLLVIDIKVPEIEEGRAAAELPRRLGDLYPSILSFLISFAVIAAYWVAHHRMFGRIRRIDGRLMWINMAFLLCIAFQPFPTALLGRYGDTRYAVTIYAGLQIASGLLMTAIWLYATYRHRLVDADLEEHTIRVHTLHSLSTPIVFFISLGVVALLGPSAAEYSWLLLIVINPLIGRLMPRRAAGARA